MAINPTLIFYHPYYLYIILVIHIFIKEGFAKPGILFNIKA